MNICIATPILGAYSETFISSHIGLLPYNIETLSGQGLDQANGQSLLFETRKERLFRYPVRKLGRFDALEFIIKRRIRWLREKQVDLVLAEYGVTGAKLVETCKQAKIPLVVHFHGYDAHNEEAILPMKDAYKTMFKSATAFIAVSSVMVSKLEEMGAPPEKIHYVPYFVDPDVFLQVTPSEAPPTLLSVGRFVEKKAPHLTIQAFAKVLEVVPDARLEMAGDGPLLGASQWQAKALGISHAIIFHGSKNHKWVRQAMSRVRGFVQHSVKAMNGDSEGTPVAVLEAQCSGLPVVATRHTGIGDVVVDGHTGFLCDEGDIEKMSNDMVRLLQMPESEINKVGSAARKRILSNFSSVQTIDKLADVIENAMK